MSSSDAEDAYENPAFDDDGVFLDDVRPEAPVSVGSLLAEPVDFERDYIETTDAIVIQESVDQAAREKGRWDVLWDGVVQDMLTYAVHPLVETGYRAMSVPSTTVLESLRSDISFLDRVEPYVNEGICAEDIARDLVGYQAGHTIYTLALHPEWMGELITENTLQGLLPRLYANANGEVVLDDTEASLATGNLRNTIYRLHHAYKTAYDMLSHWHDGEDDRLGWIDLDSEKCIKLQREAYAVLYFAEKLWQDIMEYAELFETDEQEMEAKLPVLQRNLRGMIKVTIFVHLDGHREKERRYENGSPR